MSGPVRGCLFESEIRRHGEDPVFDDFANLAIEGEMAVRIGVDGSIVAAFPVIKLHHFVFRGPKKTLPELVANNGLNGGFILPQDEWLSSDEYIEKAGTLSVRINDRQVALGNLWPMSGGAKSSLEWLEQHLASTRLDLLAGHVVLTGTPLGLYPVRRGDRVAVFVHPGGSAAPGCSAQVPESQSVGGWHGDCFNPSRRSNMRKGMLVLAAALIVTDHQMREIAADFERVISSNPCGSFAAAVIDVVLDNASAIAHEAPARPRGTRERKRSD